MGYFPAEGKSGRVLLRSPISGFAINSWNVKDDQLEQYVTTQVQLSENDQLKGRNNMSVVKGFLQPVKFGVTAEMAPPKGYDFFLSSSKLPSS